MTILVTAHIFQFIVSNKYLSYLELANKITLNEITYDAIDCYLYHYDIIYH